MAVCRIEKSKDYTVMANHHLRNKDLSLKAKGLLSLMLSLPETWDYTIKGLAHICKDGTDSINSAIRELEAQGYMSRQRVRNEKGQLTTAEYTIREHPKTPNANTSNRDTLKIGVPIQATPIQENPIQATPIQEKPTQLNTQVLNTEILNTEKSNPYPSNQKLQSEKPLKQMGYELIGYDSLDELKETVYENIEFQHFKQHGRIGIRERVDEVADLIIETLCSTKDIIHVAGEDYPSMLVKEKMLKINSMHIEYVFDCLGKNTTYVRNIKRYLLATLFNAPSTMDSYYTAMANHDMSHPNN